MKNTEVVEMMAKFEKVVGSESKGKHAFALAPEVEFLWEERRAYEEWASRRFG